MKFRSFSLLDPWYLLNFIATEANLSLFAYRSDNNDDDTYDKHEENCMSSSSLSSSLADLLWQVNAPDMVVFSIVQRTTTIHQE